MTKSFETFFSNRELLKLLSRKRASIAKKEHDKLFIRGLLHEKQNKFPSDFLYTIFPPRNEWIRLRKTEREGKNALLINAIQLERTVLRSTCKFNSPATKQWQINLYEFLGKLEKEVLLEDYAVPKPQIEAHFKEEKEGIKIFRPITIYEPYDRIIIGQVSKYLTNCFDPFFESNSYAFRSREVLKKSYSHHKAVEDIIQYRQDRGNVPLWVAECDIKKFYDCVDHATILSIFKRKVRECKQAGVLIDPRAISIFESYLQSYTFNLDVRSKPLNSKSKFGWVEKSELLDLGLNPEVDRIGVPQGGAISCLIANLIMDVVDKEVLKHQDGLLYYGRFCDDMVIVHPDRATCKSALDSYMTALRKVKLISHQPVEISGYSKAFWNSKSKAPYEWGIPSTKNRHVVRVPWLSFVGYQVHYDLRVRVRKSSMKKEIEKQIKETDKVISLIKRDVTFNVSERSIKFRLTQRILAMSVGRKSIFNRDVAGQMCWTAGFRVIKDNNHVSFQAKHLDRKRSAQFSRLDKRVNSMKRTNRPETTRKSIQLNKEPKYYGAPFSYHYQFIKPN